MFHEVKIYDSKGKVKNVVSARQLSKRHWKNFEWDHTYREATTEETQKRKLLKEMKFRFVYFKYMEDMVSESREGW